MKVEKTTVDSLNKFNSDSYTSEGLKLNTDDLGNREYVVVNKDLSLVYLLGFQIDWGHIFREETKTDTPEETKPGTVTEDFALKMLALANGQTYKSVNE